MIAQASGGVTVNLAVTMIGLWKQRWKYLLEVIEQSWLETALLDLQLWERGTCVCGTKMDE